MNRLLLPALLMTMLAFAACGHVSRSGPGTVLENVVVTLERAPQSSSWQALITLERPQTSVAFDRQASRFRRRSWRVLTPGVSLIEREDTEQLVSRDGAPFREVRLAFEPYYEHLPAEYQFFHRFSDGGQLLYTGHLNLCCGRRTHFIFKPRAEDRVILLGRGYEHGPVEWTDDSGRGTFVYFGKARPLETPRLTAVLDPGLPRWLSRKLETLLPRLFDFYTLRTGAPLTFKPVIFFSFSPDGPGRGDVGGTLPGLIQLELHGRGWLGESREAYLHLAEFLAHESAHLWNSQLFRYDKNDTWMHEGGADAFAYLALRALGQIDDGELRAYFSKAESDCVRTLGNRPLHQSTGDADNLAQYRCGALAALWAGQAVHQRDSRLGLFDFWKKLFQRAASDGGVYNESTYLDTLDSMTGSPQAAGALRRLLDGPFSDAAAFVADENKRLNISP